MTATITEYEVEVFEFEDFDVPCDKERCDSPAEYKLVTKCCGAVYFGCEPCMLHTMNKLSNKVLVFTCKKCKVVMDNTDVIVERLEK